MRIDIATSKAYEDNDCVCDIYDLRNHDNEEARFSFFTNSFSEVARIFVSEKEIPLSDVEEEIQNKKKKVRGKKDGQPLLTE